MKYTVIRSGLVVMVLLFFGLVGSVSAGDMGLVSLLTKNLGVSNEQAEGGAGAIFKKAKRKMSVDEFSQVTDAMPEVEDLINAVPEEEAGTDKLGGITSTLGGTADTLGGLTGVAGTFSKLGMDADMVGKFIPIILDYAKSKGGDTVAGLLKAALM